MTDTTKNLDAQPLPSRTCSNCACFFVMTPNAANPNEKFALCRRDPPKHTQMRGEKPRIDIKTGKLTIKDGKVVMDNAMLEILCYPPAAPDLVCFDGWRPQGTLPGERSLAFDANAVLDGLRNLRNDLLTDLADTSQKN